MTAIRNVREADAARCAKIYDVYAMTYTRKTHAFR